MAALLNTGTLLATTALLLVTEPKTPPYRGDWPADHAPAGAATQRRLTRLRRGVLRRACRALLAPAPRRHARRAPRGPAPPPRPGTDAGQRTLRMLSQTLRLPVFGTLAPLLKSHFITRRSQFELVSRRRALFQPLT